MKARKADRRPAALLLTLFGVIVIGAVLTLLPRLDFTSGGQPPAKDAGPPAPKDKIKEHAKAAIREEVDRRFNQAVVMLHAKQYDHAVTALHRVIELAPQMPEARVNMGYALLGQKQYKAAGDFFQSAIDLRPDQLNAYYGLALALKEQREIEGAIGAMRTYAHLIKPDDTYWDKAWSVLKELEEELKKKKNHDSGPGASPPHAPAVPESGKNSPEKSH